MLQTQPLNFFFSFYSPLLQHVLTQGLFVKRGQRERRGIVLSTACILVTRNGWHGHVSFTRGKEVRKMKDFLILVTH